MKRRNVQRAYKASVMSSGPTQWRLILLTIICAAIVAAGFFYAARQHFSTMEFGLKNSKLRKQIEDLEAERRRLILAKEVSLSPLEVTRNAQSLGFREQVVTPPTAEMVKVEKTEQTVPTVTLTSLPVPNRSEAKEAKPTVEKIAAKPLVKPIVQQTAIKPASPDVRPRIAETDRRVADASTKPSSKLR